MKIIIKCDKYHSKSESASVKSRKNDNHYHKTILN